VIAVIGGTGLNEFIDGEVCDITDTPFGIASAKIIKTSASDNDVFFLARHGNPHTIPPHKVNYRANLWALKELGVENVFAVNAVGGITTKMGAGTIVIPDQIVDYTYGREHTYFDGTEDNLNHIDFSYPFDERLRDLIQLTADNLSLAVESRGVYAATQGPRLETAAEINRLEKDGCDIVGMTVMPEAALAREIGLNYVSLCLVVNPAAGRGEGLITMEDIQHVIDEGMQKVRQLLLATIERL
jgi:5'-methylthioinosine phosphorylase